MRLRRKVECHPVPNKLIASCISFILLRDAIANYPPFLCSVRAWGTAPRLVHLTAFANMKAKAPRLCGRVNVLKRIATPSIGLPRCSVEGDEDRVSRRRRAVN